MSRHTRAAAFAAWTILALACGAQAQPAPGVLPGSTARTPVEIDAANLKWNDVERMATYDGDVVVTQGDTTLHASRMRIYLIKDQTRATAKTPEGRSVPPADAGPIGATGSADIRRIEADGPVTVVQKDQIGSGDSGEYDKARDQVILTGHVVLTQGQNITSGGRLVYRIASRDATISGKERVRSQFVQEQAAAQGPAKPQPVAAPAQGLAFPGAGSSREPIQIEANKLEWFDAQQKAVYSGAVTAVQGEASLRASRLTIFVLRDQSTTGGRTRAAPGEGGKGQIRRIEAAGPVTVTQKDQVATGSRAIYDKAANRVELIGGVTMTQGENVTTGSRMIYDLTTKQATMIGGGPSRAQAAFTPAKRGEDPFGGPAAAGTRGR